MSFLVKFRSSHLKLFEISGKIQYEVHSEGMNDPGCKGDSFIIVNGVDYCPHKRGHNVVVLNQCGKVVHQKAFDTTLYEEGVAMAKFLDSLPEEHVVLMAVQETTGSCLLIIYFDPLCYRF